MPQIIPVENPTPSTIQAKTNAGPSARDRAIAALSGNAPDVNASKVSPEEMGAIKRPDNNSDAKDDQKTDAKADGEKESKASDEKEVTDSSSEEGEKPLSTQYAALARKEKALRAKAMTQEQAFKAREAALAAREAEINSKLQQSQADYISKEELRKNTLGVLEQLGVTYDQLVEEAVARQSPEAQYVKQLREELKSELKAIKEEQESTKKSFEEQQTQAYRDAVNQIRNETKALVASDDSFETIRATNSVDDVVELIERTFQEDGVLMSIEQAAQAVEDYLVEEATKLANLKKLKSKFGISEPAKSEQKPAQSQSGEMKTLTNAMTTTRQLNAKERAILAFKGELNKG